MALGAVHLCMPSAKVPARVINRGRITVPVDIRRDLGISEGDRVLVTVEPFEPGDGEGVSRG